MGVHRGDALVEIDYYGVFVVRKHPGKATVGNMVPKTSVVGILKVIEIKCGPVVEIGRVEI